MKRVNFETAKLLKDIGYNLDCLYYYTPKGQMDWGYEYQSDAKVNTNWNNGLGSYPTESKDVSCSAPYQEEVKTWFRDKHNVIIEVNHSSLSRGKFNNVIAYFGSVYIINDQYQYKLFNNKTEPKYMETYEECLEYSILKAIKFLSDETI